MLSRHARGLLALVALLAVTLLALPTPAAGTAPAAPAAAITYKPWAGGPLRYIWFPKAAARGWTSSSFFPIGVWLESVVSQSDIDKDKAAGLNTYVVLTNSSNFDLVDKAGMSMITQQTSAASHPSLVGWFGDDEADMQLGPVAGPPHLQQLYDTLRARNDGRFIYNNYGKGVLFWDSNAAAARYVNSYQDVVSADLYWHTDQNARAVSEGGAFFGLNRDLAPTESEQSANYGATVDDLHRLMGATRRPQFAFIEVGQPWTEDVPAISPTQIQGAVWSSLIHGATGIVYFNHSFGGPCTSQHVLRDPCYGPVREIVKTINGRIKTLAPVLNTQSLDVPLAGLDTMVKRVSNKTYVFAMLPRNGKPGTKTFTLRTELCGAKVTVMFEGRTLPGGCTVTDTFGSRNEVHVYQVG